MAWNHRLLCKDRKNHQGYGILKIATSIAGAIQCAYLAMDEVQVPDHDGIVFGDVEETIQNLGRLGNKGMLATDRVILDMMLAGQKQ